MSERFGASDDDASRGFDPFSVVREAGVGADSLDDSAGGDLDFVHALQDSFKRRAEIAAAESKKPEGMGVAVDGTTVRDCK